MIANKSIKKIIMTPVWFLQLLTTAKAFNQNPIIGSHTLNRMGLHVLRVLISHGIMGARMWLLGIGLPREDRQFFRKNGYLLKTDFLEDELFQQLKQEAQNYSGETREGRQGNTLTHRAVLFPEARQSVPAIDSLLSSSNFRKLCRYTTGCFRAPFFYIENVKNHHTKGGQDPQKRFHTDTFHPTMKCWFFIDEVTAENGPFTFIPTSNRLTFARLKSEYQKSVIGKDQENSYARKGSMRYTDEELAALNLPEPLLFTVQPNTLVIANTFGIHKRSESGKSTRLSIYGDSRTNPFNPIPGIPLAWLDKGQYMLLDLSRRKADDKAERLGRRSPWHIIK